MLTTSGLAEVLLLVPALAVTSRFIPDSDQLPILMRGDSMEIRLEPSGSAWVRVLEEEYVSLRVETGGGIPVRLTAYDDSGDALCSASVGEDLFLSAVSYYWFYVLIEPEGELSSGGSVTLTVTEDEPVPLSPGSPGTERGAVGSNRMAVHYSFEPDRSGEWRVSVDGLSSTDLDLELYGTANRLWGGSYSVEGDEVLDCRLLDSEELLIVISRYGKSGDGSFDVTATRRGGFPELAAGEPETRRMSGDQPVGRFLLESSADTPLMLELEGEDSGVDLDLVVRSASDGEFLYSSAGYSSSEAILIPTGSGSMVAEVLAFDLAGDGSVRYRLGLCEPLAVIDRAPPVELDLESPFDGSCLFAGIAPGPAGVYGVGASMGLKIPCDMMMFREGGGPTIVFSSEQPDEEYLIWIGESDTLWVRPFSQEVGFPASTAGASVRLFDPRAGLLQGDVEGSVDATSGNPREFFLASASDGAILFVELRGKERESDLDMFVSGPEADVVAAGWLSATDRAGDESVAVFTEEGAPYGVTVYAYEKRGSGRFTLSGRVVEQTGYAEPAPGRGTESWGLVVGLSGYEGVDALNRSTMDAMEFYMFLTEEQGVPEDHVVMLVDRGATIDAVTFALEEMLRRADAEDRAIFFFSGHGNQLPPGSEGRRRRTPQPRSSVSSTTT